ncbi:MAG: hypothetical protein KF729_19905 [Sandaracinaceae bacterium]|nr:hypothetical protein [Sandaracinaceae bacterium]
MSWLDRLDPGPLATAAHRFLDAHPGAPRRPFDRGAAGLRALGDALEAWADEEPSPLDDGFVEGAGALLALLLLDHVGEGAHAAREGAHRVRLGRDGWFDPFGAVEAALDDDDPRAALALAVARAEAEAAGRAGVGRAMRILREALARERPDVSVEASFELTVQLSGEIELDLGRTVRATEGEPDAAVELAVAKLVAMLPGGAAGATFADVRASLYPRLTAPGFAASLAEHGRLAAAARLGGALEVALVVAHGDRSRYVGALELERAGVGFDEALAIALQNLAGRSRDARFGRVDTPDGPLVVARTGDGLDAARLLLPTLHAVLAPELGDAFLAAVPHRDALYACAETPALRAALTARAADDAARAPHAISARLFRVRADRLAPA